MILLYFNARKIPSTVYLGLFFVLISLCSFCPLSIFYPETTPWDEVIFLGFGFAVSLVGPILQLYVRSVLTDNLCLSIKDLWHLMPFMFFFISIPFFDFISGTAIFLIWPVLILGYTLWSSIQLISYVKREKETLIFSGQKIMIPWLATLLSLSFLVAIIVLLGVLPFSLINNVGLLSTFNTLQNILLAWILTLLALIFVFPGLLYGLPRLSGISENSGVSYFLTYDGINAKPDLVSEYLLFIQQKTDSFMKDKRPWLQSQCNLAYFSKVTRIPAHHLACYFKYIKKQSFTNFRNEWRIEHAKKLISQGKASNLSPREIGFLSGFSSQHHFFRAFKKVEGISNQTFLSLNLK